MPFLDQITKFINDELKGGSLNKKILQPSCYYGLATVATRSKGASKKDVEQLPAYIDNGVLKYITPDSKYALQVYHKLIAKGYSLEKKGYGDGHFIKNTSELAMVVIINSKLTGRTKDALEPIVLFGMPEKLSTALFADLKLESCLISPIASNMDPVSVFRQEFPKADYFLSEQMSMFLIRYKVEMKFSRSCVEQCLCD